MTDWPRVLEAGWPTAEPAMGDTSDLASVVFHGPAPHPTRAEIEARAVELASLFAAEDARRAAVKAFAARYTYDDLFAAIEAGDTQDLTAIRADAAKALRGERVEPKPRTAVEIAAEARRAARRDA